MDPRHLTPALEQLSLAEKGRHHRPPRSCPTPQKSNPNPDPTSNPNPKPSLGPARSAAFKKEHRRRRRERRRLEKLRLWVSPPEDSCGLSANPSRASGGASWPCPPSPRRSPETAGWGHVNPPPSAPRQPPSAEDQAMAAAARAQRNGLGESQAFFSKNDGEEEEEEDGGEPEPGAFEFFLNLFERDGELRAYYEKSWERGDFYCLVCEGSGEKVGKRFVSCAGLVQHSSSISKTKRRLAHRAFASAVCRELGWHEGRPPAVSLTHGDALEQCYPNPVVDVGKENASEQYGGYLKEVFEASLMDCGDLMDLWC